MYYQRYKKLLKKFKFNFCNNINFNYFIIVDIFYIKKKLILYIVNKKNMLLNKKITLKYQCKTHLKYFTNVLNKHLFKISRSNRY